MFSQNSIFFVLFLICEHPFQSKQKGLVWSLVPSKRTTISTIWMYTQLFMSLVFPKSLNYYALTSPESPRVMEEWVEICRRPSCWSLCALEQWHLADVTQVGRVSFFCCFLVSSGIWCIDLYAFLLIEDWSPFLNAHKKLDAIFCHSFTEVISSGSGSAHFCLSCFRLFYYYVK